MNNLVVIIKKSETCYWVKRQFAGEQSNVFAQTLTMQSACAVAYPYAKEIGAEVVTKDESANMSLFNQIHAEVRAFLAPKIQATTKWDLRLSKSPQQA